MHEVPGVRGAQGIRERRHRRTRETGHEHPVDVGGFIAALDVSLRQIVGHQRVAPVVLEFMRGGTVALPAGAMALCAIVFFVNRRAAYDGGLAVAGVGWDDDGVLRFLRRETRREGFDVSDHVTARAFVERPPGRHVGAI